MTDILRHHGERRAHFGMTGRSQSASCAQIAQLCAGRERIHHAATAAQSEASDT
jgi:hypothetical protein